MPRNKGTFKYIDKDKIVPFIEMEIAWVDSETQPNYEYYKGYRFALEALMNKIKEGFFDWQQGSE